MREIIFRGQTRRKGEKVKNIAGEPMPSRWAEGGIFQGAGCYSIIYGTEEGENLSTANINRHVVYTDTVGQYTGLRDKNGKRIFEGDYLTLAGTSRPGMPGIVVWHSPACAFVIQRNGYSSIQLDKDESGRYEVVGNRWDNPELLPEMEEPSK